MSAFGARPALAVGRRLPSVPAPVWPFLAFGLLFLIGGILRPGLFGLNELLITVSFGMIGAIAAMGQTVVILQGGIDLSIPNTMTISAFLFLSEASHLGVPGALVLAIAFGVAVGVVNGLGITLLRVSPIVMTIAMNGVLLGVLLLSFSVSQVTTTPRILVLLTSNQLTIGGTRFQTGILTALVLAIVVQAVLSWSGWGRMIYFVGAAPEVARFAGVPVERIRVSAYAVSGALAAFAGIVVAGFYQQVSSGMGDPYLLGSVAAVVVGGASIFGGKGTIAGTVGGALVLSQVNTLIAIGNLGINAQQILYGVIILAVVAVYGREAARA